MPRNRPLKDVVEVFKTPAKGSTPLQLATVEREIEARFLVPKASLAEAINQGKVISIRQYYISVQNRASALEMLAQALPHIKSLLNFEIKNFRLREQREKGKQAVLYFAQLKTKRRYLSRREVSVRLTLRLFNDLLQFADEGYVAKERIITSAKFSVAGKLLTLEAHIDDILELGLGKDKLDGDSLPGFLERYAIVEIELPDEKCYRLLKRESWGAFNFIETGFNLQDLKANAGAKISFRELSKGKPSKSKIQKEVERIERHFQS